MTVEAGVSYRDASGARFAVMQIEDDQAEVLFATSLNRRWMSLEEVKTWAVEVVE